MYQRIFCELFMFQSTGNFFELTEVCKDVDATVSDDTAAASVVVNSKEEEHDHGHGGDEQHG